MRLFELFGCSHEEKVHGCINLQGNRRLMMCLPPYRFQIDLFPNSFISITCFSLKLIEIVIKKTWKQWRCFHEEEVNTTAKKNKLIQHHEIYSVIGCSLRVEVIFLDNLLHAMTKIIEQIHGANCWPKSRVVVQRGDSMGGSA